MTRTFTLLLAVLFAPLAVAQQWRLTTADFQSAQVDLKSLSSDGATVSAKGEERTVPLNQFLEIERLAAPTPAAGKSAPFIIHTSTGDRIVGAPAGIEGESLRWNAGALGDITLPLTQARGFVRAGTEATALRGQRLQDVAILMNGDRVEGILAGADSQSVTIQSPDGAALPVPFDSLSALAFATTGAQTSSPARGFRVRTADGSALSASAVTLADDTATLTLSDGAQRKLPLGSVVAVEQVNGPVAWLSARTPAEDVQVPFLSLAFPTRFDRTVEGRPIRINGQAYTRGIGVHSYSKLVFPLEGDYTAFRTQYAIDGDHPYANVTVRIKLDDKVVHERENVVAGELSPVVTVPLEDAKALTLEVDYGSGNDTQDRFVWLEPALVKQ